MNKSDKQLRPEFELIDWIKRQSIGNSRVAVGIGDDAAVLAEQPGRQIVSTVDVLTEGVHFPTGTDPRLIGRKALAVNLSDIAAMAAEPIAAFVGIVLPKESGRTIAEKLYEGLFDFAQEFDVTISGGDTNSWDGPLVISVNLLGVVETGCAVLRSGATPGDSVFVTGRLGGSYHSGRHLTFCPRIREAQVLAKDYHVTAMLDLSDGLASDILHLARESGIGVHIDGDSLPVHDDVDQSLSQQSCLDHALGDGEDFELLFTVSPENGQRLTEAGHILGTEVTRIGKCVEVSDIVLKFNSQILPLPHSGWTHRFD